MYAETDYLTWANRLFGKVERNLAKSGVANVRLSELGVPESLDDPTALERLRARIARFNGVTAAEVLPALGTTHALWLACAALLSPGDELLVEHPTYEPMWRIPEAFGARVIFFDRREEEGFALDPARIARAVGPKTRAVLVSDLHNPSGLRAGAETLAALAGLGVPLIVDEVYAPFDLLAGEDGVWGRSARRISPNIIAVSSLSKTFGLTAQRNGWLLADPAIVRRAEHALTSNVADMPLAQLNIAAHVFDRLPELAKRTRATLAEKRARVAAWVKARPMLSWHEPPEGLFGLVRIAGAGGLLETIERGAREQSVLVAPGEFFRAPGCVRLAWSVAPEHLDDALARLDSVLLSRAS
jgi:hypothetical protein